MVNAKIKSRHLLLLVLLLLPGVIAHETGEAHDEPALVFPANVQGMVDAHVQTALSLSLFIALIAGMMMFISPCAFALIPTWLALVLADKNKAPKRIAAFVVGLIITYALFGMLAVFAGSFFNVYKLSMSRVGGIILLVFSALLLMNKGFRGLPLRVHSRSLWGFALLGAGFAAGWSPCVGPVFGAMIVLASLSGKMAYGALLLIAYGVGVAIPLLVAGIFASKLTFIERLSRVKVGKHSLFNLVSAVLLAIVGLIMITYKGTGAFDTLLLKLNWTVQSLYAAQNWLLGLPGVRGVLATILALAVIAGFGYLVFKLLKKE